MEFVSAASCAFAVQTQSVMTAMMKSDVITGLMKQMYKNKKYAVCLFFILFITFGIVYAQTQKAQSSISTTKASGDNMVELLARLINGEARGEPYIGQVAVGAVIMNRVKDPSFPNTIAGVIYQTGQFSCVTDGQFNVEIAEDSTVYKAAQDAMNGVDPTNGALYFYNPSKTKSKWLFSLKTVTTIGKHVFAVEE